MSVTVARGRGRAAPPTAPVGAGGIGWRLEPHRPELVAHCARILGSRMEADDAVQETFLRAWRHYDRFEGRSSLRSWLYRIATNVCLDMRKATQRRAEPLDRAAGPAGEGRAPGGPGAFTVVAGSEDDPAERAVARDSVRLAFVVALQVLPRRQRSVLILREVLRWRAAEVAELLGMSVAAVNSALERARANLATHAPAADRTPSLPGDERALLRRLADAFDRDDVDALVALMR